MYVYAEAYGADLPSTESPEMLSFSNKLAPLPKQYSYVKPIPYKPGQGDLFAPVCTVNFDNENDIANLERSICEVGQIIFSVINKSKYEVMGPAPCSI